MVPQNRLRFTFHFFGDTSAQVSSQNDPHGAFSLGSLLLHLMGDLSPSVDALTEDVIETTELGLKAEVEQLAIRWRYGPGTLEVGRFHTEIGYWNTAYHHGLWLQTPIERPHVLRFEDDGGLVPVHWVGAHYTLRLGSNVQIVGGVANGRGKTKEEVQVLTDTNDAKAVLFKIRVKGSGLEVGAGAIYDRIAPADATARPALPATSIQELDGNIYAVANTDDVLMIAEGYALHHRAAGKGWTTFAGVGLIGLRVRPWWVPYVEADVIYADDADPYFQPMPGAPSLTLYEGIVGARFEVSTWSAVKLEARLTRSNGDKDDYTGIANWSFGL